MLLAKGVAVGAGAYVGMRAARSVEESLAARARKCALAATDVPDASSESLFPFAAAAKLLASGEVSRVEY